MNKRSILVIAGIVVVSTVVWLGGHALWNVIVAMHHR